MEKLKNSPLVEAIFEIRFPAELSIECNKDKYYEKIRGNFPQILIPKTLPSDAYALEPYQFESSSRAELIRFSINRFSYIARKYDSFKVFKEKSLKYINLFSDIFKISTLKRTGLRYINHIPIKREYGMIPITKYLKFGYKLPSSIPTNPEFFQTILLTKIDDGKLRVLIQAQGTEIKEMEEIIVLDFDFSYEGDLVVSDLAKCLNDSHKHTKEVFEDLISEE